MSEPMTIQGMLRVTRISSTIEAEPMNVSTAYSVD